MERAVAFVKLCGGVEILSASECGLLSMLCCVVLAVSEKVSIIQFAYLTRSCVKVQGFSLPQCVKIFELVTLWGSYFLKIRKDC